MRIKQLQSLKVREANNSSQKAPHSSINGGNGSEVGTGLYEQVILE